MAPGKVLAMSYGLGYTDVRSPGSDDISINDDDIITRYVFDSQGRASSIYSMAADGGEIYGATFGEYSSDESSKNSLSQRTVLGGSSLNYLLNGSFESLTNGNSDFWFTSGEARSENNQANMGTGKRQMGLYPYLSHSASVYQDVYLRSGDYTLSFPYATLRCDGAEAYIWVGGITDTSYYSEKYANLNPTTSNGINSFFQMSFTLPSDGYYRINIHASSGNEPNLPSVFRIDNVMLERSSGSSDYSLVEYGSFEESGLPLYDEVWEKSHSTSILTELSAEPFNYVVTFSGGSGEYFVKQRIFEARSSDLEELTDNCIANSLILSGYANAPSAILSGRMPFRLRMDVAYYQGYDDENGDPVCEILQYNADFTPGVSGWQFTSTVVPLIPRELSIGNILYGTIAYIDIFCEYSNQPVGNASFDGISVIVDNGKSVAYDYHSGRLSIAGTSYYKQYVIYDSLDRVVREADTRGPVTDYAYEGSSRQPSEATYSVAQNGIIYSYEAYSNGTVPLSYVSKTVYDYNDCGLVECTETFAFTNNAITSDIPTFKTEYTYELTSGSKIFGALLREYNYSGSDIRYFYDSARGYLKAEVNITSGNGYAYTYDALGRMTKVVPARSTNGESFTLPATNAAVEYTYDSRGDLSALSTYTTEYLFDYDEFGNVLSISTGNNEIVSYEYNDFNGKLIKTIYANGLIEEYEYNDIDLITKIWYTEDGERILAFSYEYTASGMVHKISDHINATSTVYNYDSRDRLINFSAYNSDTEIHDYSSEIYYDGNDQVSGWYGDIQYGSLNGYTESIQYQYSYNDNGTVNRVKYSSGNDITATVNYSSDNYYRNLGATSTYYAYGDSFSLYTHYTYDTNAVDNQEYATPYVTGYESRVNGVSRNEIYSYNNAGYISYASSSENAPYGVYYWYDSLGQLIRVDDQVYNMSTEYVYDASGNLLYYTDAEYTQGELEYILGTTQFGYTDSEWGDLLTSYNGHSITYDEIGNPLSYYNGRAYTFTWSGREMSSATVGGKTYSFKYDESGMRRIKSTSTGATAYYYNGSLLVAERNSSEIIVYIYDANGSPIGMQYHANTYAEDEWDVYWFERSMLGDIIAVYASDGTKLIGYRYDAWGVFSVSYYNGGQNTSATKNSFGYRGYYYDKDLEMYYLASRYYDAKIKRFISPDDLSYLGANGDLLSYNLYAYCSNNPIMFTDPSGNSSIVLTSLALIATGALIGGVAGALSAYTNGGDMTEAVVIGAVSGAVSMACGYMSIKYEALAYITAFFIPAAVDFAVQATNQLENTGTIDFAEFDWIRIAKNGALSLASAMVPGTTVAITGTYDVGVSIITWSIASVLLGAADIANTKLGAVISEWF